MANCPICQAEFVEGQVKTCVVCGWDLTPYPVTFSGQIPEAFLEKEKAKLNWAREIWRKCKLQAEELQQTKTEFQQKLIEMSVKWEGGGQVSSQQVMDSLGRLEAQLSQVQQQQEQLAEVIKQRTEGFNQVLEVAQESHSQKAEVELDSVETLKVKQPEKSAEPDPDLKALLDLSTTEFTTVTVNSSGAIIEHQTKQAQMFVQTLGKGVTLEMIYIPGGKFLMGSPDTEEGRRDSESPQHWVTVPAFLMGKYPVTQAQYEAVMGNNPSHFKTGGNYPVERVNWHEATEFCQRLSEQTGLIYRLPSEAEWEYACRAGTLTPFHFGKTITPELVNYDGNYPYGNAPKGEYRKQTTEVGFFQVANAFGLYDMHGNVWEWCQDIWHDNYQGAPTDGSAWEKGGNSSYRLLRGGSWASHAPFCRSAFRLSSGPEFRYDLIGFRVVRG